jgi:AraC-like DNA-binding protein
MAFGMDSSLSFGDGLILGARAGGALALLCQRMSKLRQTLPRDRGDSAIVRTFGLTYTKGTVAPPRTAAWHQLLYAASGVMTVRTTDGSWVVPPHRAVWVPAGVDYSIEMSAPVAIRAIYLAVRVARGTPSWCCVVNVSPLLRELVLHTVRRGALEGGVSSDRRLAGVIVDQLRVLETVPLQLPMPTEPRAARAAEWLRAHPAECGAMRAITRRAGASRRTLERLFAEQVDMSFGRWRKRLRLLHALRSLAAGEPVTATALAVGYSSTSAFIAMFRRELGTTPSRYFHAQESG